MNGVTKTESRRHAVGRRSRFVVVLVFACWMAGAFPLKAQAPGLVQEQEVSELLRRLRTTEDAARAAVFTQQLRGFGDPGLLAIRQAISERKLSAAALRGVLVSLIELKERDPELLNDLLTAYGAEDRPRFRLTLREGLGEVHQVGSLLPLLATRITDVEQNGTRVRFVELVGRLSFTYAQAREAIEILISSLERETDAELIAELQKQLHYLTEVKRSTPKQWRDWFEEFKRTSPDAAPGPGGRSDHWEETAAKLERQLKAQEESEKEAVRAAHLKAIGELVKCGAIPEAYLDPKQMADEVVRQQGVQALSAVPGTDAKRQEQVMGRLVVVVESDPAMPVRGAAIEVLTQIGRRQTPKGDLAKRLRKILEVRLSEAQELADIERIVYAFRVTDDAGTAEVLGALFAKHPGPEAGSLRKAIVSVVFGLNQREPHRLVVDALKDPDPQVQILAANSLGLAARKEHAVDIAAAIVSSSDPKVKERGLVALRQINDFVQKPVRDAIQASAKVAGEIQLPALRCIVRALVALPEADAKELDETLRGLHDGLATDVRKALALDMAEAKSEKLEALLKRFLEGEKEAAVASEQAKALLASRPGDAVGLLATAKKLASSQPAAASILLQAVIARAAAQNATQAEKDLGKEARTLLATIELAASNPDGALRALADVTPASCSLETLRLLLDAHQRRDDSASVVETTTAGLGRKDLTDDVRNRFLKVRLLTTLEHPAVAERNLPAADFEALAKASPNEPDLAALKAAVTAHNQASALLAQFDSADPKSAAATTAAEGLSALGKSRATRWLACDLGRVAAESPPAKATLLLSRRLELLKTLHAEDSELKALTVPEPPTPEALNSFASTLQAWAANAASSTSLPAGLPESVPANATTPTTTTPPNAATPSNSGGSD